MEFIKIYLGIQKIRFKDRLSIVYDIARETLNVRIPNLILQPIVENAIRHGIAPYADGGNLRIASRLEKDSIVVEILDSGPGFVSDVERLFEKGFGLKNTRDRLYYLYGEQNLLVLENAAEGGARVCIRIPHRQGSL